MSARSKYIVAAVAGVAVLGGAAAFMYFNKTQTTEAAFEDETVTAAEEITGSVDLAGIDEPVEVTAASTVEMSGLEDIAVDTGLTGETDITSVDAAGAVTVTETETPADPAETGSDTPAEAGLTGETQPE